MIIRICITILALALVSCSNMKSDGKPDPFNNCLPENFRSDLDVLMKSFDAYVKNNYDGDKDKFLSSIVDRTPLKQQQFEESDYEAVGTLRDNKFKYYIYTRSASVQKMTRVDPDKTYLKCLENIPTSGDLVRSYIKLKKEDSLTGTLAVGRLILYSKTDPDYSTRLVDTIIAIELYYDILDSAIQ